jgi:hypothetical protein
MWGPVANAIVWGLAFSTVLSLFLIPAVYLGLTTPKAVAGEATLLPPLLADRGALPWRRWLNGLHAPGGRETLPADAIADPEHRAGYQEGVAAMEAGDLETAIRRFQWLADQARDSMIFNLCAVQALLRFMLEHGWDVGYADRARRYLARARQIDAEDSRLIALEEVRQRIELARDGGVDLAARLGDVALR